MSSNSANWIWPNLFPTAGGGQINEGGIRMKKKKGTGVKLWGILTPVLAILTVAAIFGTNYAKSASQAINIFLKVGTYKERAAAKPSTTLRPASAPLTSWRPTTKRWPSSSPVRARCCW